MSLVGKTVVLGVSGGIAAYKAAELTRALKQAGARVRVLMTRGATEFITPLTLQTLSAEPVATKLFDLTQESEIGHIQLADSADVLLVAPATANVIAKLAAGIADDLLTTVALATRAKIVVAPAMNVHMFGNPVVQENLERLESRGVRVVTPAAGFLACGYEGLGRLPEGDVILDEVAAALAPQDLAGESVLVTAGPTREYLDPVRFLSNRSSGKMGYAIARAAWRRGARVRLVSGPAALADPHGVTTVRVESAAEMLTATAAEIAETSVVIAAAAVADYRPGRRIEEKRAKTEGRTSLSLETTPDVVASLARSTTRREDLIVVGFAAETHDVTTRARAKLARKSLDLIVANDVTQPGAGFDVDTNQVTLIDRDGVTPLPRLEKAEVADAILDRVVALRASRPRRAGGGRRTKVARLVPGSTRSPRRPRSSRS